MNESKIITALEIGNSKIQVFVGEIVDRSSLRVIAAGNSHSYGIKKSNIVDEDLLSKSIEEALLKAEKRIKLDKTSLYLSITGSHLQGMRTLGSANIKSADNIVTQDDIDRANEDAMSKTLPESRALINKINCAYYLDGVYTAEPLGKYANRIDSEYWLVHGDFVEMQKIISTLKSLEIDIDEVVLSSIASAHSVSTKNDRKEGVLVIDIGAGTTDYVLYKGCKVAMTGSISVGGEHLTNDLAHGLRLCQKNAEKLKKKVNATITEDERKLAMWVLGDQQIGDRKVSLKAINTIIRARLEELFVLIRDELDDILDSSVQSVILTGGASKMEGMCEIARAVFDRKCVCEKYNSLVAESFRKAEHSTCIGILNFALENEIQNISKRENSSIFSKILNVLK